ncbi:UDP-N-acetylmuramate dehydrogenase [Balneicella halophila]|uniref:UDP-N-acetylenolpyruvoylglucosamine reductase n=1 Tax=Balneicella halophila TaxID=1537566 RepID=A0A7L4URW2_BALHA|nr:FAD-binding protein [Balneicella halophila]PVX52518.1 UDP-N-acetylmuramate dehydrogenase [Balneicella halophila]
MSYQALIERLTSLGISFQRDCPIAPHTTFRIGGEADLLCVIESLPELHDTIIACNSHHIPYKIIGGGSNILVSDKGYRGLIIINKAKDWEILEDAEIPELKSTALARHRAEDVVTPLEERQNKVIVRIASGIKIPTLMNQLLKVDISGLELFAGIPATVGGATYMNMHGAKLFFGDLIAQAQLLSNGEVKNVSQEYFQFDYDYSILHETQETVLSCDLVLTQGQSKEAKALAKEWIMKKKNQPQRSAGCLFHNLTNEQQEKLGYPTPSIGYVIDKVLGLKGKTIGGAKISEGHAAFIENTGKATAEDVLKLINEIKKQMLLKTGIVLQSEIEFVGELN